MSSNEQAPLDAARLVAGLRATHRQGRTRPAKWRLEQVHAIQKLVEENEDDIFAALHADLHKPKHEAFIGEVPSLPRIPHLFLIQFGPLVICTHLYNLFMSPEIMYGHEIEYVFNAL